jgi:subtilase family serine protease
MSPRHRPRLVAIIGGFAAVAGVLPATAATVGPSPALARLVAAVPAWAHGALAAPEPASARVDVALVLRGRHQAALHRFVAAVSEPGSPSYRHFLTPAQYAARFGPTGAEASAASSWLRSAGLTVDAVTPNRTLVAAHGPAAIVAAAFHTGFGRFRVAGRLLRAPLSEPQVPASLASSVLAVTGLAQTRLAPAAPPQPAFVNARPCSRYYGQKVSRGLPTYAGHHPAYAVCGYTPAQLRSAYGVSRLKLTGRRAAVGIVDAYASPSVVADVNHWSRLHGLPKFGPGQFTQHLYPGATSLPEANIGGLVDFDPQGWQGEETLDVEAVHAMAPAAKIAYFAGTTAAPADPGLYVAEAEAIEGGEVQVVSNSWSLPDDSPLPTDQLLMAIESSEAAATGVTLDFATGDEGDEIANIGVRNVDFPSDSPLVTAVGGTTLRVSRTGRWLGETYWGTEKIPLVSGHWAFAKQTTGGAAGGGNSILYPEPSWQRGVVPPGLASYGGVAPGRVVPDVAMDGDPTTGMLIGETMTFAGGATRFGEFRIGGTSVSCPLFSGLLALAVQRNHGRGLGLVTPTLYHKARTAKGRRALFRDPSLVKQRAGRPRFANVRVDHVDPTNPRSPRVFTLRTLGNLGTLHQRRGYDDSTGLGSPRAAALIALLR